MKEYKQKMGKYKLKKNKKIEKINVPGIISDEHNYYQCK